jgi:hypothetical protein
MPPRLYGYFLKTSFTEAGQANSLVICVIRLTTEGPSFVFWQVAIAATMSAPGGGTFITKLVQLSYERAERITYFFNYGLVTMPQAGLSAAYHKFSGFGALLNNFMYFGSIGRLSITILAVPACNRSTSRPG